MGDMAIGGALVTLVLTIFAFGLIMGYIPDSFTPVDFNVQDTLAVDTISASNLILYSSAGSDETFLGYSSLDDGPTAPDWNISETDYEDWLEVWWDYAGVHGPYLELRHVNKNWLGAYQVQDYLTWFFQNGAEASEIGGLLEGSFIYLPRESVVSAWSSSTNSSAFTAACSHLTVSIVLFFNETAYADIGVAFDDQTLGYAISYTWNPDTTGFGVLTVITDLLTFQGVNIGVPGILGTIIDAIISTFFYIAVAYIAYKIIAGLIPFVSGNG